MEKAGEDGVDEGIRITVELAEQIKSWGRGFILCRSLTAYDVVAEIVGAVK